MHTRHTGVSETDMTRNYYGESTLGNAVADSMLWAFEELTPFEDQNISYVAFVNSGAMRADLDAGNITYGMISTTLPYANTGEILQVCWGTYICEAATYTTGPSRSMGA